MIVDKNAIVSGASVTKEGRGPICLVTYLSFRRMNESTDYYVMLPARLDERECQDLNFSGDE